MSSKRLWSGAGATAPLSLLASVALGCAPVAQGQEYGRVADTRTTSSQELPQTRLEALMEDYQDRVDLLPAHDKEDPIALPSWFRAYLRSRFSDLPESGSPQYPRPATGLLEWMRENPELDSDELESRTQELGELVDSVREENERRSLYPKEWEHQVAEGTRLASLQRELSKEFSVLPERDLEDTSPLPIWFRVYLRKQFADLPTSGPYQYPRTANRILQRYLSNPDSEDIPEPEAIKPSAPSRKR